MTDINTGNGQGTSEGDGKNSDLNPGDGNSQGAASDNKDGNSGDRTKTNEQSSEKKDEAKKDDQKLFSQADVERMITDRLNRERKAAENELERQKREAEMTELRSKGEFEILLKKEQERTAELEQKLVQKDVDVWRAQAAAKFKLGEDLQERLIGESLEDLMRDAESLSKLIRPAKPELEGGPRGAKASETARQETEIAVRRGHRYTGL